MMRRLLVGLVVALPVLLVACTGKTMLRFSNETECGTATITLTNIKTGSVSEYTVDQGSRIEIELEPDVEYRYEVEYPRQPDYMQCDSKRVTTMLSKGKTLNIRLTSVLDPALQQATLTPAPPG